MRTHVDLFSGIGGFALAARWAGVGTIAFAEIDPYANRVLKRHWPNVRNYGRVQDVPAIDAWLLTGGVPCQPASIAGERRGVDDDRWLWPEALAAVERIRPAWVLLENPTGILSLSDGVEFERICVALESQGYEVQPIVIPACGVDAPHIRNRVWILAHAAGLQSRGFPQAGIDHSGREGARTLSGQPALLAHDPGERRGTRRTRRFNSGGAGKPEQALQALSDANGESVGRPTEPRRECSQWAVEPDICRVADGIPERLDRLRCLGNAIVPQVAYQLIKRMIEAEID